MYTWPVNLPRVHSKSLGSTRKNASTNQYFLRATNSLHKLVSAHNLKYSTIIDLNGQNSQNLAFLATCIL